MKGVQCYELFGGIALKNHALFFLFFKCYAASGIKMCENFTLRFVTWLNRLKKKVFLEQESNCCILSGSNDKYDGLGQSIVKTRPIVNWSGLHWALPGLKLYRLRNLLSGPS